MISQKSLSISSRYPYTNLGYLKDILVLNVDILVTTQSKVLTSLRYYIITISGINIAISYIPLLNTC
jgi:hypothetical protein